MGNINAIKERVARDQEERERLEKDREELERREEERKKKEKEKRDAKALGKIFRVTAAGFLDPDLGRQEMKKIEGGERRGRKRSWRKRSEGECPWPPRNGRKTKKRSRRSNKESRRVKKEIGGH